MFNPIYRTLTKQDAQPCVLYLYCISNISQIYLFGSIAAPQAGNLGLIPVVHTNCQDWWLSPVTLLLGDKDIGMVLVT